MDVCFEAMTMRMKKPVYLLVSIVLFLFMGAAITPVAACEDPDHDIDCACDGQPTKIVSVLDLGEFTISNDIMSSTPYWTFLIGGKKEGTLGFYKKERSSRQKEE